MKKSPHLDYKFYIFISFIILNISCTAELANGDRDFRIFTQAASADECSNSGGIEIIFYYDENQNSDFDVADTVVERIVLCNGQDGLNGLDGRDGRDGRDGDNGQDGSDGEDGVDGEDGADGVDGEDGTDGSDGEDGVNGEDGEDGDDGRDGQSGQDGQDGQDGVDGQDGQDGANGQDGQDGQDGRDGEDGNFQTSGFKVLFVPPYDIKRDDLRWLSADSECVDYFSNDAFFDSDNTFKTGVFPGYKLIFYIDLDNSNSFTDGEFIVYEIVICLDDM